MSEEIEQDKKRSAKKHWRIVKGRVYARFRYQDEHGKWREKLKPIEDKRTARTVVEQMRRELTEHGEEALQNDKVTFAQLAAAYLEAKVFPAIIRDGSKVSGLKSHKAIKTYVGVLTEYFGKRTLRSIKPADLERFKKLRLETRTIHHKTRKVSALNRELSTLRAMLNFALEQNWIIKSPVPKVFITSTNEIERNRILSFDEEKRLLAECKGRRAHLKTLLLVALDCGLRRGEILQLRWSDVDFTNSQIFIRQTNTKTETSRRVGITGRLNEELEKLWAISPKEPDGLLFGGLGSIKTSWRTVCRLARVKDFRLHDCRHVATTRMIASGSSHIETMEITGHEQLKTFKRYLSITAETANNVSNRLDEYLKKKQIEQNRLLIGKINASKAKSYLMIQVRKRILLTRQVS